MNRSRTQRFLTACNCCMCPLCTPQQRQYQESQGELVLKVVETASTYVPVLEAACNLVAELDVLIAMAHAAALAPTEYVRPAMKDAVSVCFTGCACVMRLLLILPTVCRLYWACM